MNNNIDAADLAMLAMYHQSANPDRGFLIVDIDGLIELAVAFNIKHAGKNWERAKIPWDDALFNWYNKHKYANWNNIPSGEEKERSLRNQIFGQYLCNDHEDYDAIEKALRTALKNKSTGLLDNIRYRLRDDSDSDYVIVWEKVEYAFSVKDFCEMAGITITKKKNKKDDK